MVEPIEIFTNLSECDFRDVGTMKKDKKKCEECKISEKQYFMAESRYLHSLH